MISFPVKACDSPAGNVVDGLSQVVRGAYGSFAAQAMAGDITAVRRAREHAAKAPARSVTDATAWGQRDDVHIECVDSHVDTGQSRSAQKRHTHAHRTAR